MKRKAKAKVRAELEETEPNYPTFQTFRESQKVILKTVGAGAVGLAMSSCQPEPPVLGGVPPVPSDQAAKQPAKNEADSAATSKPSETSANKSDCSATPGGAVLLGGVPPLPEGVKPQE